MSDYVFNDAQEAPFDFRFDSDWDQQYIDPALLELRPLDSGQSG